MKIGIVGTEHTIRRIRSILNFEELFIEALDYPCELEEVVGLLDEIQGDLDAILFTGNHHYAYACRSTSATIPWSYAKRTNSSILRVLLQAVTQGLDVSRITYDLDNTTVRQMAGLLYREAGVSEKNVEVFRFNDTPVYMNYMALLGSDESYHENGTLSNYRDLACKFHLEHLESGRASLCLSGSSLTVQMVREMGYPAFFVQSTEEELIVAVNELRIRHETRKRQRGNENYLAVLDLRLEMTDVFGRGNQEYRQLNSYHQIESIVYAFAQGIGAAVEKQDQLHYLIYTTRFELDVATDNMSRLQFLKKFGSVVNIRRVSLGIGFGRTHNAAKNCAQHSGMVASKQKANCYYMMTSGEMAPMGPFNVDLTVGEREPEDIQLERIARETGVGTVVLNMLEKAQSQYGFNAVTTGTLAEMCEMTVSNMNRIVSKLEAKGYAQVVGSKPHSGAGRPSRLIRLKLTKFN